ncbi:MAG: hypothetical protein VW739_05530 [Pelagibacteraceae bacterium]
MDKKSVCKIEIKIIILRNRGVVFLFYLFIDRVEEGGVRFTHEAVAVMPSSLSRSTSQLDFYQRLRDPLNMARFLWPGLTFYKKQRDLIYSVKECDETQCAAGNMLGKDFTAGFLAVWFFLSRPRARIVTTSVDQQQLASVLWGEIRRFISTAEHPLPIVSNHLHLRKIVNKQMDGLSYTIGRVAAKGEGMLGHHLDREKGTGEPTTFFIADEASGVDNISWERADTWAHRKLAIGNPFPCVNFFYQGVKNGVVWDESNTKILRNIIKIKATDSPNVQLGLLQERRGEHPSDERLIPGVLRYSDYKKRRRLWDPVLQSIGLDGEFWEGAEALLYPPQWLNQAEAYAREIGSNRKAKAIGIDPAEGGDKTTMAAVDEYGLIELVSKKTPDTSAITGEALAFMRKHGVDPEDVMFDSGGGGKQHADRLRSQGYDVQTVAFGSKASYQLVDFTRSTEEREEEAERRYVYKNRRAEMYGLLRRLLDPADDVLDNGHSLFGISEEYVELRRQLSLIPLLYDDEGCMYMLSKGKSQLGEKLKEVRATGKKTLIDIIGHSPDEADALVIAIFCMIESQAGFYRTAGSL